MGAEHTMSEEILRGVLRIEDALRLLAGYGRIAVLEAENIRLRQSLINHRADLHNYSKRPCPTCRESAKVLGIAGKVPDCCAQTETDAAALRSPKEDRSHEIS